MAFRRLALVLISAAWCVGCGSNGPNVTEPAVPTDIWQGVYTAAQAQRGLAVYADQCVTCHAEDLSGVSAIGLGDYSPPSPPLAGRTFLTKWDKKGLDELLMWIQTQMPHNAKGTLGPEKSADVLAFLLEQNEFPPGPVDLPSRPDRLRAVKILARRPESTQ